VVFTCEATPVTLTITKDGTGSGAITTAPGGGGSGIDCGTACTTQVVPGTTVTLSVAPAAGSAWSAVSGNCTDSTYSLLMACQVTVTGDTTVDFSFTAGEILTVTGAGGSIIGSPAGIDCEFPPSGTWSTPIGHQLGCAAAYALDTTVTLTFAKRFDPPAPNEWVWSGGGCSGPASAPCSVAMTGDVSVSVVEGP
jgi:hypothetical protein